MSYHNHIDWNIDIKVSLVDKTKAHMWSYKAMMRLLLQLSLLKRKRKRKRKREQTKTM